MEAAAKPWFIPAGILICAHRCRGRTPSPASGAWAAEAALAAAVPCEWSLADICPQAVPAYSHKDQHLV